MDAEARRRRGRPSPCRWLLLVRRHGHGGRQFELAAAGRHWMRIGLTQISRCQMEGHAPMRGRYRGHRVSGCFAWLRKICLLLSPWLVPVSFVCVIHDHKGSPSSIPFLFFFKKSQKRGNEKLAHIFLFHLFYNFFSFAAPLLRTIY